MRAPSGSGTVANEAARDETSDVGHSCLAERRMLETIWHGTPRTPWLSFGDRVRIEMQDAPAARSSVRSSRKSSATARPWREETPTMSKAFASQGDLAEKRETFDELARACSR